MTRVREVLGVVAVSFAMLLALEGLVRVATRVREGYWPCSTASERFDAAMRLQRILMPHPYLIGVPRPGGSATFYGRSAQINSLGYRGGEFTRPKPDGVFRVLAIGGSTTFDVCVTNDESTWPSRLEEALLRRFPGRAIEVVNAGVPGYTTVEMLLKLELIDFSFVEPDLVIALVGLNDLQPSAAPGFRPDYSVGHAEIQRRFLGLESRRPGPIAQSVLLHKTRRRLGLERNDLPVTPRSDAPLPEAEAAYRTRLAEIVGASARRGAPTVLLTQVLRFGVDNPMTPKDSLAAFHWLPYLTAEGIVRGMARYNDITREVAASTGALLVDLSRDLPVGAANFADYCHWSDAGAVKMADFVAERLPDTLFADAPPRALRADSLAHGGAGALTSR